MDDEFYFDGDEEFISEEDMYQQQQYYQQIQESHHITFHDLRHQCVEPIFFGDSAIAGRLAELFACCLLVLFVSCLNFLPKQSVPLTSTALGITILYRWFNTHAIHLSFFVGIAYVLIYFAHRVSIKNRGARGLFIGCFCFLWTLLYQFRIMSGEDFLMVRSAWMVLIMKFVSVAYDLDGEKFVNPLDFASYCLNVSTVLFGPWISYAQYETLISRKSLKNVWTTVARGSLSGLFAALCLIHSACFLRYLIPDDYDQHSSWIIAFRDATAFRFSHYFASLTSEASLFFSGFFAVPATEEISKKNRQRKSSNSSSYENEEIREKQNSLNSLPGRIEDFHVVRPFRTELPRSLVDVVVNWNIPMHNWFKNYVFLPVRSEGGNFVAIFTTYAASSLLHGFNFQISAVLLSLGFYTYAEDVLRKKLAKGFNACIAARKCRECKHDSKKWNPVVVLVNFGFFALAVFHLTYLGMVFDSDEEQEKGYSASHTLEKWSQYGFASHYVALSTFIFALII